MLNNHICMWNLKNENIKEQKTKQLKNISYSEMGWGRGIE